MTASARSIGILAGSGSLPREIADSVAARNIPVHIVAIEGEADADFGTHAVTRVNWGEIGRMVTTLRDHGCTDLVIIGGVRRPDLGAIKPDRGFFRALATVARLVLAGGDDKVLRGVIGFFEGQGLRVVGPAQLAPELVIGEGAFTPRAIRQDELDDARRGFAVVAALGKFDIGQAAVVSNGRIEALEAAEGTDGMLARVIAQRRGAGTLGRASQGILIKRTKPTQDARVDLPAIGPETVRRATECGLSAIVVEAGRALAADRQTVLARAASAGIAIAGISTTAATETVGQRAGKETSSFTRRMIARLRRRREIRSIPLQQIGKAEPPQRARRDAVKGFDILDATAHLETTRAVVVVRGHVLALECGEGVAAAVERAGRLRQWGDRRLRRRAGVVVVVAGRECDAQVVEAAARGGFAGVVVRLRKFAAGVAPDAVAAADKAGLFVVGIGADTGGRHG